MKHKTTLYWSERGMVPEKGYEPVDPSGKVFGYVVCLPEVSEKVNQKRLKDYEEYSKKGTSKLPVWC